MPYVNHFLALEMFKSKWNVPQIKERYAIEALGLILFSFIHVSRTSVKSVELY